MTSRSRIGIDARLYSQTGVGRYIRNLIAHLAKMDRKHDYTIFITSDDKRLVQALPDNFRLHEVNIRWHSLFEQTQFPKILGEEQLDLVHFPYFSLPIFYRKPFIVTIHDLTPDTHATGRASTLPQPFYLVKRIGYKAVLTHAISQSCKVIVPSNATRDALIRSYPGTRDKVVVTYEGVERVTPLSSKPLISGKYFLYVGNAYPHKNVDRLIKAFITLPERVNLVLVGGEDFFYQKIKKKIEKQNEKRVIFFGNAEDSQLANLYRHALALISPSLSEGFGLPALEAMAYGCCVIVSSIAALIEVCGNAAVYVDPANVESIREGMLNVYQGTIDTAEYKKRGLRRASQFDWKTMAKKTLTVYESCLGIRSRQ